ncbi:MAG: hypothetical protein ACKOBJ_07450 [Actinomycetota bacterium]
MTKPRTRGGAADKAWSIGLAGATCLGLVGLVGVRTITDTSVDAAPAVEEATSSSGLTRADLDAYANALDAQSAQLDNYRVQLTEAGHQLQAATGKDQKVAIQQVKKRKNFVPRPQAAPQLAAQGKTRSS